MLLITDSVENSQGPPGRAERIDKLNLRSVLRSCDLQSTGRVDLCYISSVALTKRKTWKDLRLPH